MQLEWHSHYWKLSLLIIIQWILVETTVRVCTGHFNMFNKQLLIYLLSTDNPFSEKCLQYIPPPVITRCMA